MGRTRVFLFAALLAGCSGSVDTPPGSNDAGGLADATDTGASDSATQDGALPGKDASLDAGADTGTDAALESGAGGTTADGGADSGLDGGSSDAGPEDAGCDPAGIVGADSDSDGFNDEDDCMPCDPLVNPNAGFHPVPRSDGLWDWNCDGVDEKQYPNTGKCVYPGCTKQQGFYKVPPCGGKGELIDYCISNTYSCGTQWASFGSTTQSCR